MATIDQSASDAELMSHIITKDGGSFHLKDVTLGVLGRCVDALCPLIIDMIQECRRDNFITPSRALQTNSGVKFFASAGYSRLTDAFFVSNGGPWYSFVIVNDRRPVGRYVPGEIFVYRSGSPEAAYEIPPRDERRTLVFSTRTFSEESSCYPDPNSGSMFHEFLGALSAMNAAIDHSGLLDLADAALASHSSGIKPLDGYPDYYIASMILAERICKKLGRNFDQEILAQFTKFSDEVVHVEASALIDSFDRIHEHCAAKGLCDAENEFDGNDGEDRAYAADQGGEKVLQLRDQNGRYKIRQNSIAPDINEYVIEAVSRQQSSPAMKASFRRAADGSIVNASMGVFDVENLRNWTSLVATVCCLDEEIAELNDSPAV